MRIGITKCSFISRKISDDNSFSKCELPVAGNSQEVARMRRNAVKDILPWEQPWSSVTFLEGCTRWPLNSLLLSKLLDFILEASQHFAFLFLGAPWTLLPSPYAAPNTDSLDPGWTGCYCTLDLQKTPGHFLPACHFPNSADPLRTPQVIVKRFLFFFFLDAQLLPVFTIFWLSNSSFWLKMKKAAIKMPWTTRAKFLLLWLNTSQTTLQIANMLKTAVMCSWWAMELHLWGSPWLSSTRCLEKHLNQLPTSELLNIKTKCLLRKVYQELPNLGPWCALIIISFTILLLTHT